MVRADDVTLAGTSWKHCVGQTVSMKSDPTTIGVILEKERGGFSHQVKILRLDKVLRFVSFHNMDIMVPEPPGF
jgi:orotate phosphoribosyltransferase-like protein